jgi:hypothetical protein
MGRTTRQSLSILLDGLYMCFFRSMLGLTTQKFVFFFLKWSVKKHYFRVRRRSTILTRPKIETVFFPSSIILVCFCVMIITRTKTVFMGKPSRIMSSHKYNCRFNALSFEARRLFCRNNNILGNVFIDHFNT